METQNCSQKVLQLTISPSNLGTTSLGSFTPEPSVERVVDSVGEAGEYISLLIFNEQSNTPLSRPYRVVISLLPLSRSMDSSVFRVSPSELLISCICSPYCCIKQGSDSLVREEMASLMKDRLFSRCKNFREAALCAAGSSLEEQAAIRCLIRVARRAIVSLCSSKTVPF